MFPFDKKVKILIVCLIGLILLLLLVIFIKGTSSPLEEEIQPSPLPSEQGRDVPLPSFPPLKSSNRDAEYLQKDYERISSREQLGVTDSQVRSGLTNLVDNESGVLNNSAQYRIEYAKEPNYFMVEIKVSDADQAKKSAEEWFRQRGLSAQGICDLPVVFYLNSRVNSKFKEQNKDFNQVPTGC